MNTKKLVLSTLFVAMLTIPTVLGAIPFKIVTPVGVVSTKANEVEARNRNTSANRPRSLSARNSGAQLVQRFSANRRTYTVNVRQSTGRADIRIGIREGQQHRWRIDTRNDRGNWVNGSYNSWKAQATRNVNRDVRVRVNEGQERRLRVQIRDRRGNVRTITVNVRRASGCTVAANLRANAGRFIIRGPVNTNWCATIPIRFPVRDIYALVIPRNRTAATRVGMRADWERGQARNRVRIQNADGSWRAWSSWSSYTRGQSNRSVGTIPRGRHAQVQFMIRGAFSNMPNSPTRTRVYTVNIARQASAQTTVNWDVVRPQLRISRTSTSLTLNRPFNPGVFEYLAGVPDDGRPRQEVGLRLALNWSNQHLADFELRRLEPGFRDSWHHALAWQWQQCPMDVVSAVYPVGRFVGFEVRHIPTREVRTYRIYLERE